jgi:hypothetical protein
VGVETIALRARAVGFGVAAGADDETYSPPADATAKARKSIRSPDHGRTRPQSGRRGRGVSPGIDLLLLARVIPGPADYV